MRVCVCVQVFVCERLCHNRNAIKWHNRDYSNWYLIYQWLGWKYGKKSRHTLLIFLYFIFDLEILLSITQKHPRPMKTHSSWVPAFVLLFQKTEMIISPTNISLQDTIRCSPAPKPCWVEMWDGFYAKLLCSCTPLHSQRKPWSVSNNKNKWEIVCQLNGEIFREVFIFREALHI